MISKSGLKGHLCKTCPHRCLNFIIQQSCLYSDRYFPSQSSKYSDPPFLDGIYPNSMIQSLIFSINPTRSRSRKVGLSLDSEYLSDFCWWFYSLYHQHVFNFLKKRLKFL